MAGKSGLCNLSGMRGRRKGGLHAAPIHHADKRSLETLSRRFLEKLESRGFAAAGIEGHGWALKQFLAWARRESLTNPRAFSRSTLEGFQQFLFHYRSPKTSQPLAINTQLARLGAVRRFFAWLCREGIIPANPAADLELPRKQSRNLPKFLSHEEITRLLTLPDLKSPFGLRDRTILELFYATGIRRSEMANLDSGDYDPSLQTLLIRRGKGGKSRLLPIGARASGWLDRYLADSRSQLAFLPAETSLFLSGYGTRLSPAYLGNWVSKTMKKANISKLGSCHLFRHSCATHMLEGGADIRYIQSMLGHARIDTTQIYTHVSITALKEVHAQSHPHGSASVPSFPSIPTEVEIPPIEMVSTYPNPSPSSDSPEKKKRGDEDDPNDRPPEDSGGVSHRPPKPPKGPSGFSKLISNNLDSIRSLDMNDYGYRYYHTNLGRWLSRDPIGEEGGLNLYAFADNNAASKFDKLGMIPFNFDGYPFVISETAGPGGGEKDDCLSAGGEWTDFINPNRVENFALLGVLNHKLDKLGTSLFGGNELDAIGSSISAVWDKNPCSEPKTVISFDLSQVPEKLRGYMEFDGESSRLAIQSRVLMEEHLKFIKGEDARNNISAKDLENAIRVRFCCKCVKPKGW